MSREKGHSSRLGERRGRRLVGGWGWNDSCVLGLGLCGMEVICGVKSCKSGDQEMVSEVRLRDREEVTFAIDASRAEEARGFDNLSTLLRFFLDIVLFGLNCRMSMRRRIWILSK